MDCDDAERELAGQLAVDVELRVEDRLRLGNRWCVFACRRRCQGLLLRGADRASAELFLADALRVVLRDARPVVPEDAVGAGPVNALLLAGVAAEVAGLFVLDILAGRVTVF